MKKEKYTEEEKFIKKEENNLKISLLYVAFKFVLFVAICFLFIFSISPKEEKEPSVGINKGDYLPEFNLKEIGSEETFNLSDFKGKKLIVIFWASWCPYCSETSSELENLLKSRDDIIVVGINSQDVEDKESDVTKFLEEKNFSYKNGQLSDSDLAKFQIESFPTILFVDSKGVIQEGVVGGLTKEMIEERFETIN